MWVCGGGPVECRFDRFPPPVKGDGATTGKLAEVVGTWGLSGATGNQFCEATCMKYRNK